MYGLWFLIGLWMGFMNANHGFMNSLLFFMALWFANPPRLRWGLHLHRWFHKAHPDAAAGRGARFWSCRWIMAGYISDSRGSFLCFYMIFIWCFMNFFDFSHDFMGNELIWIGDITITKIHDICVCVSQFFGELCLNSHFDGEHDGVSKALRPSARPNVTHRALGQLLTSWT